MRVLGFSLVVLAVLTLAAPVTAVKPEGPVTITTAIDFTSFPFSGPFTVADPNVALGCLAGTFVDFPDRGFGVIEKHFTCTSGGNGTFVVLFLPLLGVPGPGVVNGHWTVLTGTDDFATLRGRGEFSLVFTGPDTGEETLTGFVHFRP